MQNIGNFYVASKVGEWVVDRKTGLVVKEKYLWEAIHGHAPLMFDIDRWKKTYRPEDQWDQPMALAIVIDIMAIGLWYRDKEGNIQYERPAL